MFNRIIFSLMSLTNFNDPFLAGNVIKIINSYGIDFKPDIFDAVEPLKQRYSEENINNVVNVWLNTKYNKENAQRGYMTGSLLMEKRSKSKISYFMEWHKNQQSKFHCLDIAINSSYAENTSFFNRFFSLCEDIMLITNPVNAQIWNWTRQEPIDLKIRHPELKWLNVFGKPYIDLFGRERLLSTPCYKIHKISENLIGLQLAESVLEEIPEIVFDKVKKHLGEDAFVEGTQSVHNYKSGRVPKFDFSEVLFDINKPIEEPKIIKRQMPQKSNENITFEVKNQEAGISGDNIKFSEIKKGSKVVIRTNFGAGELVEVTVLGIDSKNGKPIFDYEYEGRTKWSHFTQIEKVIKA